MSTSLHADRRVQPVRSNRLLRLHHVLTLAMHWPAQALARQRAEQTETAALRLMGQSERRDLYAAAAQLPAPAAERD
jgi:hypothetical protein